MPAPRIHRADVGALVVVRTKLSSRTGAGGWMQVAANLRNEMTSTRRRAVEVESVASTVLLDGLDNEFA